MIRSTFRFAPMAAPLAFAVMFGAAPASAQSDPSVDLMLQAVAAGLPASAAPQLVQDSGVCASRGGQMMMTAGGSQVCIGGIAAPGGASQLGTVSLPGVEAVRVETATLPGQGSAQQPVSFTAVPAPQVQQFAAPAPMPAPVAIPQPPVAQQFVATPAPAPAPVTVPAPAFQQFAAPAPAPMAAPAPAPLPAALPSAATTATTTQSFSGPTFSAPVASAGQDGFVTMTFQSDPAADGACRQQGGVSAYGMDGRFLCLTGAIYRDIPFGGAQQPLPAAIRTQTVQQPQ